MECVAIGNHEAGGQDSGTRRPETAGTVDRSVGGAVMKLAKRIRDLRYAKGWGPDDLAGRAKISRTALYQIESGKTEVPRAATLRRIARALGVATEELLPDLGDNTTGEVEAVATAGNGASVIAERVAVAAAQHQLWQSELERKFRALLSSPLREGIARFVEETYRLLPLPAHDHPAD
jgi:transcriptional regulator with XRE-family HTH domain